MFSAMKNVGFLCLITLLASCITRAPVVVVFGFSPSSSPSSSFRYNVCNRRQLIIATGIATTLLFPASPSLARAPGSKDIVASIQQIQDAADSLRHLVNDDKWSQYTVIDTEGRAGSTDGARRILGGIAPMAGSAAINAAKNTPLYRIDVAFVTVRKAILEDNADEKWTAAMDLDRFEELADRIIYNTQKADGNFYSVLFAQKGTKMINDIFIETKTLVKQAIMDFDEMIKLLENASAPGFQL